MASLVIGALAPIASAGGVGGALGAFLGSATVKSIGVSVGIGLVQRALTPNTVIKQQGSRLTQSQITTSTEGSPINDISGTVRTGGQLIWATTFKESVSKSSASAGGKGGPKQITEVTQYRYSVSFAVGVCRADGDVTLGRVWADGKPLDLSNLVYRFYDGASDQLPDPKIESVEGVGTVPAYRGLAYVVFEDMDIENYGRRIPQITVEVTRSTVDTPDAEMEKALRAVNIIPGSGEFAYGTEVYSSDDGVGNSLVENSNTAFGTADFLVSMDDLQRLAPNVSSASLVVSWFGSSTDATLCEVRPKVDNPTKVVVPEPWRVSDVTRSTAQIVTSVNGGPAYGGTPSDHTVREAVVEMKDRGLRVMFYPFLLMDAPGYPWRGRITGDPTAFVGSAAPSDFARDANGQVTYTGPDEWTHRRMILHYAALLGDLLEPGDAFLVGSEMVGLSSTQVSWGTALASLIADVRTMLPADVKVSYASDWSEYRYPALTPVWSSADFIGIDWYMPLTNWRGSDDEVYDRDVFIEGVTSGEYWDYYFATDEDRQNDIRTPITDPAFRQKDVGGWRDSNHVGKPIWLTEFGCPAVDKGANQPNLFIDPKSDESKLPFASDGSRNDTVQRLYNEAMLAYFGANTDVIDPDDMFAWSWDARPHPYFPSRNDIWSDAANYETGHWLNGRLGGTSLATLVVNLCAEVGIPAEKVDTSGIRNISTRVEGFHVTALSSPSAKLENLMDTYLFDAYEDAGVIRFIDRTVSETVTIDERDLVADNEGRLYTRRRTRDSELPERVKVDFIDAARDYNPASVDGHTVTGRSNRVATFTSMSVLTVPYARALADVMVHEAWIARDTMFATVMWASEETRNTYFAKIKPGVLVAIGGRKWRVRRLSIGDGDLEIEGVGYETGVYGLVSHRTSTPSVSRGLAVGRPLVDFVEAPLRSAEDPAPWSPRIVARQSPWPGGVSVYRGDGSGGYSLNTIVPLESTMGETTTALPKGTPWVWDSNHTVTVRMYGSSDNLISLDEASVLNGANAMLIETPSGEWEVFQYTNTMLNEDGTYTLSRLLRGQLGTEAFMGDPTPAGSRVIVYDAEGFVPIKGTSALTGVDIPLRYGPSVTGFSDDRFTDRIVTPRGVAYRPYAPVHLSQRRDGSDIQLSWVRRTRFDGDTWEVSVTPLNEDFERYEVDILDGSTVVRTLVVDSATSVTYTQAQQVADFGSAQSSVAWVVHQMSAIYGRGAPAYGNQ